MNFIDVLNNRIPNKHDTHAHYQPKATMRPLRFSLNVTLDGCYDHTVMIADEDVHRHAMESIAQCDALLFGRVTYEMMLTA